MKIRRSINWGHPDSYAEFEAEIRVIGTGLKGDTGRFENFGHRLYTMLKPQLGVRGKFLFTLSAAYKLYEEVDYYGAKRRELKYEGTFGYGFDFDWVFVDRGVPILDDSNIIFDPPVTKENYENGSKAVRLSAVTFDWNDGKQVGNKFVRLTPRFAIPSQSATKSTSVTVEGSISAGQGVSVSVGGGMTWTNEHTTTLPSVEKVFGEFQLGVAVPRVGPPDLSERELNEIYAMWYQLVGFANENQRSLDKAIKDGLDAWKMRIEKNQKISQALRDGKITVYIDGFASKTQNKTDVFYNEKLSKDRAMNVKNYIQMKLGVPDSRISLAAHGSDYAKWHVEVDKQMKEVFKPRDIDRVVMISMKTEELIKAAKESLSL